MKTDNQIESRGRHRIERSRRARIMRHQKLQATIAHRRAMWGNLNSDDAKARQEAIQSLRHEARSRPKKGRLVAKVLNRFFGIKKP